MFTEILNSLRAIVVLTILTSVIYPLIVTGVAQIAFPSQANGSLIKKGDQLAGSSLLAQKFEQPRYFWARPSAADYATVASGASNQSFTSAKLAKVVEDRRAQYGAGAPPDLLTASGSGLDPDISVEAARYQVGRVARTRGLTPAAINKLVDQNLQAEQFGFLGQPRVNVLVLNMALDQLPVGEVR